MAYEAKKICNLILSQRDIFRRRMTNLRINKLLYLVHGWYLTHHEAGLVRNHFEAWSYGPVIRTVYDHFKIFGEDEITEYATFMDYEVGIECYVPFNEISLIHRSFISSVVSFYDQKTTFELVELTHVPEGPWARVAHSPGGNGRRIPNDAIRRYFLKEIGDMRRN